MHHCMCMSYVFCMNMHGHPLIWDREAVVHVMCGMFWGLRVVAVGTSVCSWPPYHFAFMISKKLHTGGAAAPGFLSVCHLPPLRPSLYQVCSGHGTCLGLAGYCSCFTGYVGAACASCASEYVLISQGLSRSCVFLPGAKVTCSDGVRNGNEDGVDCGGSCITACDVSTKSASLWRNKVCLLLPSADV